MTTFRHLDPGARFSKGSPDPADVYVVPELTQMSVGFMLQPEALVANRLCPSIPVGTQSGKYISYPRGHFFRDDMQRRADGAESAGGGFAVDNTPQYNADVWAWHTDIGPQVRANAKTVDVDRAASILCANKAMLRREILFLSQFFKTGVWSTQVNFNSGGAADTDLGWLSANAKPIRQIKKMIRSQQALHGYKPNKITFDTLAWDTFCEHPNVVSRVNAGQTPGGPAEISQQMVAQWLGLDEVLVTQAVKTTSAENQPDVLAFVAGTGQFLLTYTPPSPGLFVPSAFYFFDWMADGLVGGFGTAVSRWFIQERKAMRYEIEMATDCKLVSADLGAFGATAVS